MMRKYPSVFLLAATITAIILVDTLNLALWWTFPAALLLAAAGFYCLRRKAEAAAGILLCLALGAVAASHFTVRHIQPGPNDLAQFADPARRWTIYGEVVDWPDLRVDRTELTVRVDSLEHGRRIPVRGALLLKIADTATAVQRGDRIIFAARIYPVHEPSDTRGFDYGRYLRLHGIRAVAYVPLAINITIEHRSRTGFARLVDGLRTAIRASFERNLAPVPAALASGFLIGETRKIPPDVYRLFRDSGTLHLLAVSGSNVALVVLFLMVIIRPFGLSVHRRSLLLLVSITVFSGLCYGEPSVIRASVMAALVIAARMLGRSVDLNHIIALTALIILAVDPAQLYDIGFQLSFITAWGLILLVPEAAALFESHHTRRWYRWLVFPLLVALIAQVVSTPVVVVHFHRIPAISVVANLIIVPMVSVAVIAALILLVADLILPLLGVFVGSLVNIWMQWVLAVLVGLGGDHMPVFDTSAWLSDWQALLLAPLVYVLLVLGVFGIRHRTARRWFVMAATPSVAACLLVMLLLPSDHDSLRVTVQTVPGGVAALVECPGSSSPDLVLTGISAEKYDIGERILLPILRQNGVSDIGRLFLLGADFGALDDILRFADSASVDTLAVTAKLLPSVEDAIAAVGKPVGLELLYLNESTRPQVTNGYQFATRGLELVANKHRLVLSDKLRPAHFDVSLAAPADWLIVGEAWIVSIEDWLRLRQSVRFGVVWARVKQKPASLGFEPALDGDQIPLEYCLSLFDAGRYVIEIPANEAISEP